MVRKLAMAVACVAALITQAALAQDAVKVAPGINTVLVDNSKVRVIRSSFAPGASEGTHTHPAGWYIVTKPGTLRVTTADGKVEEWKATAGEQAWIDGEGAHKAENIGESTLEYVFVEVKGASAFKPN